MNSILGKRAKVGIIKAALVKLAAKNLEEEIDKNFVNLEVVRKC